MQIHPIANHSTLPDVPTSTGDDHLQYWADTTIGTGTRAKDYSTTGTVDVGKLIVRKADDATIEFIDDDGTHFFHYDTGLDSFTFDDQLEIDRTSSEGMRISRNRVAAIGGNLELSGGAGFGIVVIDSDWTVSSGKTCENIGSITTGDWNGGTIDNTIIGGTIPAAGNFSTVDIDGGTFDNITSLTGTTASIMSTKSGQEHFEATPTLKLWCFGDIQPLNAGHWTDFDNVITDILNIPFDFSLVVGDIVDNGQTTADFVTYLTALRNANNPRNDFYHLAGNHDYQSNGTLDNYKEHMDNEHRYTLKIGNILIIVMSDEVQSVGGDISVETFDWWENLVVNNQDKNIIVVSHQPLFATTLGSDSHATNYSIADSSRFTDVLENYDIDMWVSGHVGLPLDGGTPDAGLKQVDTIIQKTYGLNTSWHMNVGLHLPEDFTQICSRVLNFTEGSTACLVQLRNHTTNSFETDSDFQKTITLKYAAEITGERIYEDGLPDIVVNSITANTDSIADRFVDNSLIGWWQFNGTANDSSDNGNDGTLQDGASVANNILECDGTGDYVDLATFTALSGQAYTVVSWFRIDGGAGTRRTICEAVPNFLLSMGLGTDNKFDVFAEKTTSFATVANIDVPSPADGWHQIASVYKDGTLSAYMDGEFVGSNSGGSGDLKAYTGFHIGRYRNNDSTRDWDGALDDLRVYDRDLDAYEIRKIYNEGNKDTRHFNKLINTSGRLVGTHRYTTTQTLNATDYVVSANTDGSAWTLTLPAGIVGTVYEITNTGDSNNNLTIAPDGSEHLIGVNSNWTLFDGETLKITYRTTDGWY